MPKEVEKVLAYITRFTKGTMQVLVFEQVDAPEAGVQVPAGTVEPGESLEEALLREIQEESGLSIDGVPQFLGRFAWFREDRHEIHHRNVFHIHLAMPSRDEWTHVVSGDGEDRKMVFQFYWLEIETAQQILAADQGSSLPLLASRPAVP